MEQCFFHSGCKDTKIFRYWEVMLFKKDAKMEVKFLQKLSRTHYFSFGEFVFAIF